MHNERVLIEVYVRPCLGSSLTHQLFRRARRKQFSVIINTAGTS